MQFKEQSFYVNKEIINKLSLILLCFSLSYVNILHVKKLINIVIILNIYYNSHYLTFLH